MYRDKAMTVLADDGKHALLLDQGHERDGWIFIRGVLENESVGWIPERVATLDEVKAATVRKCQIIAEKIKKKRAPVSVFSPQALGVMFPGFGRSSTRSKKHKP